MNISEQIFYLKDDNLYKVTAGALREVTQDDMLAVDKPSLLIDDNYFFYIGMDGVSVTGKKLYAIAENYLSTLFPNALVKSFGVSRHGDYTIIYVMSDELVKLIDNLPDIFRKAKKISSPFISAASVYDDFTFFDGSRCYKKVGGNISIIRHENENYITQESLLAEMGDIKASIQLPGIKKNNISSTPFIVPAIAVAVCYIVFVIASIFDVIAASKADAYYNDILQGVYKNMKVDNSTDPYGILIYKSKQMSKSGQGKRVIATLNELADFADKGASLTVMSIRDKNIRAEGVTEDFAKIEELSRFMQDKLKTNVTMDDTKKTDNGVTFVMRYEYQ